MTKYGGVIVSTSSSLPIDYHCSIIGATNDGGLSLGRFRGTLPPRRTSQLSEASYQYIPVRIHQRQHTPHTIVGVPQFPDLINLYNNTSGHGGGLGMAAAGASEPVTISTP